jgi:transposase
MPTRLVARPGRGTPAAQAGHRPPHPASWIQRARIVVGSWDGATVTELAERLGCRTKTVYKWLHRSNDLGIDGLGDLLRPGLPRRITEIQRGRIIQLARSTPPGRLVQDDEGLRAPVRPKAPATWTLDTLAEAPKLRASGLVAARSAGSCWPRAPAGAPPSPGRPAPTRTSSQRAQIIVCYTTHPPKRP